MTAAPAAAAAAAAWAASALSGDSEGIGGGGPGNCKCIDGVSGVTPPTPRATAGCGWGGTSNNDVGAAVDEPIDEDEDGNAEDVAVVADRTGADPAPGPSPPATAA